METYKITHIYEEDFGCEGRPDGKKPMVEVVLKDAQGKEKRVREEDAWLYEKEIQEGDLITFLEGRIIHA
ncbi:MAG: hypothetical protein ACI4HI_17630 [Lachnospiraceae bacterium]